MVKLYVEGGGDASSLKTACREAFSAFISNAGINKRPRVVACGSRANAFESYCTAVRNGEEAMLLVDSEDPIDPLHEQGKPDQWRPWLHLGNRVGDRWEKPADAPESDCHLMTQCMESWLMADRKNLGSFFGQGFKENQLPAAGGSVERIPKIQLYACLAAATKDCKTKAPYGKGEHSFKLLKDVAPATVIASSGWAKRFINCLKQKMG